MSSSDEEQERVESTNSSEESSSPTANSSDEVRLSIENTIAIENVQEETNLIHYTENHFNTKIQHDLEKIKEMFLSNQLNTNVGNNYISNSPISTSNVDSGSNSRHSCSDSDIDAYVNNYDSDNDNDNDNDNVNQGIHIPIEYGYKKLSYRDVEKIINKYYDLGDDTKLSSEVDILTTYIKGQKNLFIQAKHSTQGKLNCLMFPSLLISAFITIIAPFIECMHWSGGLISGLNAIIMLCVSFINYLRLESSIENYMYIVKQYDKLETSMEMTTNKLMFMESNKEKTLLVLNKIRDIERKINEIKESTVILLPEDVKLLFPIICHINIFSFIKKVELFKKNLIVKFKDVKNEIRYILYKLQYNQQHSIVTNENYTNRLQFLHEIKNKLKAEIFEFQSAYSQIDTIFTKEIKLAESRKHGYFYFWRKHEYSYCKGMNPVLDKYFHFIFVDE
jgi:hypothetical protein